MMGEILKDIDFLADGHCLSPCTVNAVMLLKADRLNYNGLLENVKIFPHQNFTLYGILLSSLQLFNQYTISYGY